MAFWDQHARSDRNTGVCLAGRDRKWRGQVPVWQKSRRTSPNFKRQEVSYFNSTARTSLASLFPSCFPLLRAQFIERLHGHQPRVCLERLRLVRGGTHWRGSRGVPLELRDRKEQRTKRRGQRARLNAVYGISLRLLQLKPFTFHRKGHAEGVFFSNCDTHFTWTKNRDPTGERLEKLLSMKPLQQKKTFKNFGVAYAPDTRFAGLVAARLLGFV
jgi:hypothetical protein